MLRRLLLSSAGLVLIASGCGDGSTAQGQLGTAVDAEPLVVVLPTTPPIGEPEPEPGPTPIDLRGGTGIAAPAATPTPTEAESEPESGGAADSYAPQAPAAEPAPADQAAADESASAQGDGGGADDAAGDDAEGDMPEGDAAADDDPAPGGPTGPTGSDTGESQVANGAEVYTLTCARCHGELGMGTFQGNGLLGASTRYSHGMLIEELTSRHPVTFGFGDKLSTEEISAVAAYVLAAFP